MEDAHSSRWTGRNRVTLCREAVFLCSALLVLAFPFHASGVQQAGVTGFWRMVADEDKGPLGEIFEIREGGQYIAYDRNCVAWPALNFHLYRGDVYVTSPIPSKGPVAVVFHPVAGDQLSFTSPRTHNTAFYARVPTNACVKHH